MSSASTSLVEIRPVSDISEIPTLASIFDTAIRASGDEFNDALAHYVEDPLHETITRLRAAVSTLGQDKAPEQSFVFKAVETVTRDCPLESESHGRGGPGEGLQEVTTEEKIVGMAHWSIGYINLPKADPFAQQELMPTASIVKEHKSTEAATLEDPITTSSRERASSEPMPELEPFDYYATCRRPVRNAYISQMRGKKHVFLRRIAVHPDFQRRGIARQLLQWGLDQADSEKIVSYLNARPQALRLYESGGFRAVATIPQPVPGFKVSDMIVMVRQRQSETKV